MAYTLGQVFFPESSSATQLIAVYGVLAASFALRPLGGVVLGAMGDRIGRQRVLAFTITLMAGSTFAIGLLPTYSSVGLLAPVLLVVCRILQGFSTGGEYSGAATFMAEYSPDSRRGFYGSFLESGTRAGSALGATVALVLQVALTDAQLLSWGWRVPFLLAAPLGLIGLYVRYKLEETPVFQRLNEAEKPARAKTQAKEVLSYWKPLLFTGGMVCMLNITAYTLGSYMPGYLQGPLGVSSSTSFTIVLVGYLVSMVLIIPIGSLSDRVGRKPLWLVSGVGIFCCAVPAFVMLHQGVVMAIGGLILLDIFFLLQLATISATFPAYFPSHVRYAALALSYNVATAVFGGTAPMVNSALIGATGNSYWPAYYLMLASVVGVVAVSFAPETRNVSLHGTKLPGVGTVNSGTGSAQVGN